MKLFKKILKIVFSILFTLLIVVYLFFVNFSSIKSDEEVLKEFEESIHKPFISYVTFKNFEYRVLSMQEKIDTLKTTVVFVHGAPGSLLDFKKYLADSLLNAKSNMISYDRIGYGFNQTHLAQKSLDFGVEILRNVVKDLNLENTIIVGYSYGGPIALAMKEKFKNIVLLAPSVYSKVEPMPFVLHFYKWKMTRWLVPKIWKSASEEKMNHPQELEKFEKRWIENPSQIIDIHGDEDGIVPFENSLFLKEQFSSKQFELINIPTGGHSLVWSNFTLIKAELLKLLN